MMSFYQKYVVLTLRTGSLVLIVLLLINGSDEQLHRGKRDGIPLLLFPRTSPTRAQIISGIGIPVALEFESVTIGYVFKAEYFLPENASNVLDIIDHPFTPTERPLSGTGRRRRRRQNQPQVIGPDKGYDAKMQQKFEKYNVEAMEIESGLNDEETPHYDEYEDGVDDDADDTEQSSDDNDLDERVYTLEDIKLKKPNSMATARFTLYRGIEKMAEKKGFQGRPCMLRSICEAAAAQFSYANGILGELAHIVMTPSTTPDEIVNHADNEYLHAEELGRSGAPCDKVFKECSVSILNQFSGIYNAMDSFINMFG